MIHSLSPSPSDSGGHEHNSPCGALTNRINGPAGLSLHKLLVAARTGVDNSPGFGVYDAEPFEKSLRHDRGDSGDGLVGGAGESPFLDVAATSLQPTRRPIPLPSRPRHLIFSLSPTPTPAASIWIGNVNCPASRPIISNCAVHGTAFWDESKTFPANVNDFTDQTVKQGVTYDYRLTALDMPERSWKYLEPSVHRR